MILVDTSGLLAALNRSDLHHEAAAAALRDAREPRLLSPFVLAELDYLLTTRVSPRVARTFLADVAAAAYQLEPFGPTDVVAANAVLDRYPDRALGLADASIVVLSQRHHTTDVLTLDERHFRAIAAPTGGRFRILPADATATSP